MCSSILFTTKLSFFLFISSYFPGRGCQSTQTLDLIWNFFHICLSVFLKSKPKIARKKKKKQLGIYTSERKRHHMYSETTCVLSILFAIAAELGPDLKNPQHLSNKVLINHNHDHQWKKRYLWSILDGFMQSPSETSSQIVIMQPQQVVWSAGRKHI